MLWRLVRIRLTPPYNCLIEELIKRGGKQLACYIPSFVVDQVLCACKFEDTPPKFRKDLVVREIGNLFAEPSIPFESLAVKEQLAKAAAVAEDPAMFTLSHPDHRKGL